MYIIGSLGCSIKLAAILVADVNVLFPSLKQKVGIVAKMYVFSSDATIDLEDTVFIQSQGRTNGIRYSAISSTNRVLA